MRKLIALILSLVLSVNILPMGVDASSTPEEVPIPIGLMQIGSKSTSVTVQVDISSEYDGYYFMYSLNGSDTWESVKSESNVVTLESLVAKKEYLVKVQGYVIQDSEYIYSDYSDTVICYTQNTELPIVNQSRTYSDCANISIVSTSSFDRYVYLVLSGPGAFVERSIDLDNSNDLDLWFEDLRSNSTYELSIYSYPIDGMRDSGDIVYKGEVKTNSNLYDVDDVIVYDFKAERVEGEENDTVNLFWSSMPSLRPSSVVDIERSEDGKNWRTHGNYNYDELFSDVIDKSSTYYYRIRFKYGQEYTKWSNIIKVDKTADITLTVPTIIVAQGRSYDSANIRWSCESEFQHTYVVEIEDMDGNIQQYSVKDSNGYFKGLKSNTDYKCRVKSVSSSIESGWSEYSTFTTPEKVFDIKITDITRDSAKLEVIGDLSGHSVNLYDRLDGRARKLEVFNGVANIDNLDAASKYSIEIWKGTTVQTFVDSIDFSTLDYNGNPIVDVNDISHYPIKEERVPKEFKVQNLDITFVTFCWNLSTTESVNKYLYIQSDDYRYSKVFTELSENTFSVDKLMASTSYEAYLVTIYEDGQSIKSNTVMFTTKNSDGTGGSIDNGNGNTGLDDVTGDNSGADDSNNIGNGDNTGDGVINDNGNTGNVNTDEPGDYDITDILEDNEKNPKYGSISGLRQVSGSQTVITVEWDDAKDGCQRYEVAYKEKSEGTYKYIITFDSFMTFSGLKAGTTYEVMVRVNDKVFVSSWESKEFVTQPKGVVSGLKETSVKSNSVSLSWNSVIGVNAYYLDYCEATYPRTYKGMIVYSNKGTINGLKAGTKYEVTVYPLRVSSDKQSISEKEIGDSDNIVVLTTPKTPTTVKSVQFIKSNKIKFSTGFCNTATKYYYQVYKNNKKVCSGSKSQPNFIITNKKFKTVSVYKVRVRAKNSSGYSKWSSWRYFSQQPKISKIRKYRKSYLRVTWKKLSGAKRYILYGSTKKSGNYKKIATTSKTSYVVKTIGKSKIKKNKKYYFYLKSQVKVGKKWVTVSMKPSSKRWSCMLK